MITEINIIGERVSGTCFLEGLIKKNTSLKINKDRDMGYKHFFYDLKTLGKKKTDHILFIYITRDIMEWLQSFSTSPYHASESIKTCKNLSNFIRHEWSCIYDETFGIKPINSLYNKEMMHERNPSTKKRFENVIKMRTSKIEHSLKIKNIVENFIHVKYEDVRDDPSIFLESMCIMFQIPRFLNFTPIKTVKDKGAIEYIRKEYPEITEEDTMFIISEMDEDLEARLGYI